MGIRGDHCWTRPGTSLPSSPDERVGGDRNPPLTLTFDVVTGSRSTDEEPVVGIHDHSASEAGMTGAFMRSAFTSGW